MLFLKNRGMKFVVYTRVSSDLQKDNYSFEAQMAQVEAYLKIQPYHTEIVKVFQEVMTGRDNKRPKLAAALELAKREKAKLICSRVDRLARNASFCLALQESNIDFVFLDALGMGRFEIGILALLAQRESENTSARVKSSLKIVQERLKAQGKRLGNPRPAESLKRATQGNIDAKRAFAESALVSIKELNEVGITSYNRLAECLNKRGEKTRLGKPFTATAVRRIMLATARN